MYIKRYLTNSADSGNKPMDINNVLALLDNLSFTPAIALRQRAFMQ